MATSPYALARQSRKDDGNRSRIVIESPGVKDETEKKPKITLGPLHREESGPREMSPDEVKQEKRSQEIKERGGAYSDRIKIKPKFEAEPRKVPLPSDTDIQRIVTHQEIGA